MQCLKLNFLLAILLMLILYPVKSLSQWSNDPAVNTPVCTEIKNQTEPHLVGDGEGGIYIVWRDLRNETSVFEGDIYAQKLDSSGIAEWIPNGIPINTLEDGQFQPQIINDTAGGFITVWEKNFGGLYYYDIYSQRLNTSGELLWQSDGMPISTTNGTASYHKVIPDENGGAFITWEYLPQFPGSTDIYAQHINSEGLPFWVIDGMPISLEVESQSNPVLEGDGNGGVFISWMDGRNGFEDLNIYAQHISNTGYISGTENGFPVCTYSGVQSYPQIISDNNNGAIVVWLDNRNGNSDIFSQRIDSSGNLLWDTDGVAICNVNNIQNNFAVTTDNNGGAIISWTDLRNDAGNIFAQRIDGSGNVQWTENGIPICITTNTQDGSAIISDDIGGAIITWLDKRNDFAGDIYAQRINSEGIIYWEENGVPICTANNEQSSTAITGNGENGAILVWYDKRNLVDYDIYAQLIDKDGNLGGITNIQTNDNFLLPEEFSLSQNYPNPFNPATKIKYQIPEKTKVTLKIYDIIGNEIDKLVDEIQNEGRYEINYSPDNKLSSGIYFYKLTTDSFSETKKMAYIQ